MLIIYSGYLLNASWLICEKISDRKTGSKSPISLRAKAHYDCNSYLRDMESYWSLIYGNLNIYFFPWYIAVSTIFNNSWIWFWIGIRKYLIANKKTSILLSQLRHCHVGRKWLYICTNSKSRFEDLWLRPYSGHLTVFCYVELYYFSTQPCVVPSTLGCFTLTLFLLD